MPEYAYHAVDNEGTAFHGVMSIDSESKLDEHLQKLGYWLIEAKEQTRRQKQHKARVSRRELIDFFNGMATLLAAGVNIADALKAMIEETVNESFKYILEDIEVSVQSGISIYEAMSKHANVFTDQACNIVHAGEYGGNLATTFNDLSHHLEWVDQLMADVKQASIYPGMIILAVIGLISLLFSFVVPKFIAIFDSAGLQLPALTRAIVVIGHYWWLAVVAIVAVIAGSLLASRYVRGINVMLDKLKLSAPVFGSINRMLIMSRFVHNLALMAKAGVPILDALSLCRKLVASPIMEDVVRDAEIAVNEGRRMSEALRQHNIVSPLVLRMLVVGEETGNLDEALLQVSERFDIEIPRRIKRAFGIMEPAIILILIGVVGLVAGAVFLPMFSLMSGLGS